MEGLQKEYDSDFSDVEKVYTWSPFDPSTHAKWFDSKRMLGVDDGFDVVVGNPPYIPLQRNNGALSKRYKDAGFKSFAKMGDIYLLFYERGYNLLKSDMGILGYITSNTWLKAEYGEKLRKLFADHHRPLRLIEMGKDVFEEAGVDVSILFVREGKGKEGKGEIPMPAIDVDWLHESIFPPPSDRWGEARPNKGNPWAVLSSTAWNVLDKMRSEGKPLKDWNIIINLGIKTGCDKAFVISESTKKSLAKESSPEAEIINQHFAARISNVGTPHRELSG